jgi:hypothetical protein
MIRNTMFAILICIIPAAAIAQPAPDNVADLGQVVTVDDDGIGTSPTVLDAGPGVDATVPDFSAGPELPEPDAGAIVEAAKGGKWRMLLGLMLVAMVWALRRWGSLLVPYIGGDRGGVVLALGLPVLGYVGMVLAGAAGFSLDGIVSAITIGLTASGLWTASKRVAKPRKAGA